MVSGSRPLFARLLLDLLLRGGGREYIRGDIEEEYEQRRRTGGRAAAPTGTRGWAPTEAKLPMSGRSSQLAAGRT